jgi:predicted DCC family thiol-disulfide oxidoreductase YuxK
LAKVILFDGVCNLCNRSIQFVIRHDPNAQFQFAPLQSDVAHRLLCSVGDTSNVDSRQPAIPDSFVLLDDRRVFRRSTAALRIVRQLRFPWRLLYALMVVPRPMRDWVYDRIARNRYRWFGQRDTCMVPTPELRARFLDWSDASQIDTAPARPLR